MRIKFIREGIQGNRLDDIFSQEQDNLFLQHLRWCHRSENTHWEERCTFYSIAVPMIVKNLSFVMVYQVGRNHAKKQCYVFCKKHQGGKDLSLEDVKGSMIFYVLSFGTRRLFVFFEVL